MFLQTAENEFHPAINMHNTYSFEMLDANIKSNMTKLYFDFFYKKHNEFWSKKAIAKLPHIIKSTNMLPCGEDLGMIPDCVAPVMQKLNILSLEIQRMSKNSDYQFVDLNNVPYLSVCSPSTHDMPTLRGWWEEDKNNSQFFYNSQLKQQGEAPKTAEPIICEQIIAQHLNSNSILAIFPIQDLLAMDKKIRWNKIHKEQINKPENSKHRWKYRMYQNIEDLVDASEFNDKLKQMINDSQRG